MDKNKTIAVFGLSGPPPNGRGPEIVCYNLLKGLDSLGLKYLNFCNGTFPKEIKSEPKEKKDAGDFNILVNPSSRFSKTMWPSQASARDSTLIGPCVESIFGSLFAVKNWKNFLVASEWHRQVFLKMSPKKTKGKNIFVWPIGVDTEKYKPKDEKVKYDCIIHAKHRNPNELPYIESVLKKLGQTLHPQSLRWAPPGIPGCGYLPQAITERCNECKYCIILDGAETQGIANMEIMSTNTPVLVFDVNAHYNYGGVHTPIEATSVPYFSDECGMVLHEKEYNICYKDNHDGVDKYKDLPTDNPGDRRGIKWKENYAEEKLSEFLKNLGNYNPRDYILREHTLEKSALNLIEIFEKISHVET